MYIETSYPRVAGQKARLTSPIIKTKSANDVKCRMRMYYHMFGKDVNSLQIYQKDAIGGKLKIKKTIKG